MTTTLKRIELSNRVRLPYVEQGDPSGVPVLFLHGYPDSWRSFEPVLPHLPPSIRATAVTQRGHGDADKPAGGYAPRDFAADAVAFMDALGLPRAVVVGHSMGSYIAQRVALDHPERVAGLVLVGSFPTARRNPVLAHLWNEAVSSMEDPIDRAFVLEFQSSTVGQPIPDALLDIVVQESLKAPARVWRAALRELIAADHSAELARITAPTLILWGTRDGIFPRADQDALVSAIPGARLLVYQTNGHSLHWEEPERFANDVAAFVEAASGLRKVA
jgi:non-heme chloroperoxidase